MIGWTIWASWILCVLQRVSAALQQRIRLLASFVRPKAVRLDAEMQVFAALLNKSELKRKRPSSLNFSDLHRDWHPKICHPIQCRRTDPSLRFLLRQGARFHRVAENALVSLHRNLDMTA